MRLVAIMIAVALIAPTAQSTAAQAAEGQGRKAKSSKSQEEPRRRRPSTEAADGTCHRDTGRPFHSLSLNSRCDREEFWQRFNDTGGNDLK